MPDTPLTRWLAAGANFVVPGLGYALLGETRRGVFVGGGILLMFVLGLFIGGVGILDDSAPNAPFVRLGQRFMAPALVADAARLRWLHPATDPTDTDQAYTPSYSHMEEQGILFTALAGFLNLMTMVDIAGRLPAKPERWVK